MKCRMFYVGTCRGRSVGFQRDFKAENSRKAESKARGFVENLNSRELRKRSGLTFELNRIVRVKVVKKVIREEKLVPILNLA